MEIDGELDELTKFSVLTSDQRVKHIIERAEYYGFSGERVKGLVFCSNENEAAELSQKFNQTGKYSIIMLTMLYTRRKDIYLCRYLSGRIKMIRHLKSFIS